MQIEIRPKIKPYKGGIYIRFFKRFMDIILSLIAIIVLSPILLIVSVLVRIKLGSPIIFKQKRPGLNEKIFTIYKFRTMTNAKDENGQLLPDSIRLTKFGKFLRSTSLDELPELFNIFKGDMSIVGPRPLLIEYLPYYTVVEKLRHSVKPGLSGLAQINGRNNLEWDNRLALDVDYVRNVSFIMDIKIIAKTILKAFKREDVTVVDLASLKDLHVERAKQIDIKILTHDEYLKYRDKIEDLLLDSYRNNFDISDEYCNEIVREKIVLLDNYIVSEKAIMIGAIEDGALVGFIWIYKHNYFEEVRFHINQIVVDNNFRGRGIGKKLIKEAEKIAVELGVETVDLFVSECNINALNMYSRLGFVTERRYLKKKL